MTTITPSARPNIAISEESVKELREWVEDLNYNDQIGILSDILTDLLAIIDDYATIQPLVDMADDLTERNMKLEAENERLQRQVEIEQRKVADLDGLLAKYQGAAKEAEAQLAKQAPLIEAAGKLNGGDLAWFDWMMETTIAEYAPRVDGMTCPGRGRKDRFRALFSALPDEVKP
jgi:hypothetical protein